MKAMNGKAVAVDKQFAAFERLNYYFGKLMSVQDFTDQQRYLNEKRWLINRYGIGWGIVCGLGVKVTHNEEDCAEFLVMPGLAFDAYGHEIWVCDEQELVIEKPGGQSGSQSEKCYYIYLNYLECPTRLVPLPTDSCSNLETNCVAERTRETFEIVIEESPIDAGAEASPIYDSRDCEVVDADILDIPHLLSTASCPNRPPKSSVLLAKVLYSPDRKIRWWSIDTSVSKQAMSNETLYSLIERLRNEQRQQYMRRIDRRRNVPLLTQTIPGLTYQDGRIHKTALGTLPYQATTDGNNLWVTDRMRSEVHLIEMPSGRLIDLYPEHQKKNGVAVKSPAWGIAYDGAHLWTTHYDSANDDYVSRINPCRPLEEPRNISITTQSTHPRGRTQEIVYDGKYLWVAHGVPVEVAQEPPDQVEDADIEKLEKKKRQRRKGNQGKKEGGHPLYMTIIDPIDCSVLDTFEVTSDDSPAESAINAMAYDGEFVWVTYDSAGRDGLQALKLDDSGAGVKLVQSGPIECMGRYTEGLAFDGTHIWVTHESGVTKIDPLAQDNIDKLPGKEDLEGVAFDGQFLWAGQPGERTIKRIDPISVREDGGEELTQDTKFNYSISSICFDGHYLWAVLAAKDGAAATGHVYRLLP